MPFVPVYKGFIWIIQCYRSVSPSDFHRALLSFMVSEHSAYNYLGYPLKGSFIYSLVSYSRKCYNDFVPIRTEEELPMKAVLNSSSPI